MTKSSIPDFSTTASSNTDVDGVGLNDGDSARNLRDGLQALMRILKRHDLGEVTLDDLFKLRNSADTSKTMRFDLSGLTAGEAAVLDADLLYDFCSYILRNASDKTKKATLNTDNIPASTNRSIDVEVLFQKLTSGVAPIETRYTASGTHTFAATTQFFQIEAVGGGGGGGGVDGQGTGTRAAASGGGSGFFGLTAILPKGALTTGTVVIGTGGGGGAGLNGSNGSNGSGTTWVDATPNSFAWGGGKGGVGSVADTGTAGLAGFPNSPNVVGAIIGSSDRMTTGFMTSAPTNPPGFVAAATGGLGGNSPYGQGGGSGSAGGTGSGVAGGDAIGYGAGGGGASVTEISTNFAGGAGAPGYLIVREW